MIQFDYDAEGNLTQTTDPQGQIVRRSYDVLNRLVSQVLPAGSDVSQIDTTYDANGNVDTITETQATGTEVTRHRYDPFNRLVQHSQRGHVMDYTYDANGNRTQVSSPGGTSQYTYDSRNRLNTVVAGSTTQYQYLANNWLQQVVQGNGTRVDYDYDAAGRVTRIDNLLADGQLLSRFAYTYDANGNRTQQVERQNGLPTAPSLTTDYRYDALDRLVGFSETGPGHVTEHRFTYYPSYDRKTEVVVHNGVTLKNRSYDYNGSFELTQVTETAGGSITYQYDANGNRIHSIDTTGGRNHSTRFEYNSRNQLTRVAQGAPGAEVGQGSYAYNYAGMRTRHLGSERGDIEYLYDGDSIIDELHNNSTSLVAHYRYGDRLLSLTSGGSDQFYHYASLGTTANLTNAAGAEQVAYRTDPFGQITQQAGTSVNRHVFTGQEHDEQTGLIYFGARFYDPDVAGFINQDSYLGESTTPPSLHRYLYAYSNPTVYFDPNGHTAIGSNAANLVESVGDEFGNYVKENYNGSGASDWLGMGFLRLGEGFLKGTAFAMNAVDHGVNWTSMAAHGFGNDDWAIEHASEIKATDEKVSGMVDFLSDSGNRADLSDNVFKTMEGVARLDKESIGNTIEFGGGWLTGPGLKAKLPGEAVVTNSVKNAGTQVAVRVGSTVKSVIAKRFVTKPKITIEKPSISAQADAEAGMAYEHPVATNSELKFLPFDRSAQSPLSPLWRPSETTNSLSELKSISEMNLAPGPSKFTDGMNDKQFSRLVKDIQANGMQNKTIQYVDIEGMQYIVVGNNRVMAAQRLGITDQLRFQKVEFPVPNTNFNTVQDVLDASGSVRIPKLR